MNGGDWTRICLFKLLRLDSSNCSLLSQKFLAKHRKEGMFCWSRLIFNMQKLK
ncbi:hypothetical protein KFK09_026655 [Dendrobium nobile]|uniref:Uncharacterized protein n=1 Tax=Dendrobium nobile TaxID=94219 RepID=A0A8T3A8Q7_DENNO|nr:hypothetical protein KFK09_026655 [Dendrobium nobile]